MRLRCVRDNSTWLTFIRGFAAASLLLSTALFNPAGADTDAIRFVRGDTIFSAELPKANLTIKNGFRYVGTQHVNLYGLADAEQYLFAKEGRSNTVDAWYWVQFEHYLPTNSRSYTDNPKRTTKLGQLQFSYDVRTGPDYAAEQAENPGDGAAIVRLLATKGLSFPDKAFRVRMFHYPSADHRSELMIIYGEALGQDATAPVRKSIDDETPELAQAFLERARQGITVQVP